MHWRGGLLETWSYWRVENIGERKGFLERGFIREGVYWRGVLIREGDF